MGKEFITSWFNLKRKWRNYLNFNISETLARTIIQMMPPTLKLLSRRYYLVIPAVLHDIFLSRPQLKTIPTLIFLFLV